MLGDGHAVVWYPLVFLPEAIPEPGLAWNDVVVWIVERRAHVYGWRADPRVPPSSMC